MLEFKKEYFQTETNRHLYPTTLDISKCEVYGCKDREAFVYKIPNNYYSSNAGNIDFTLYPNGVWSDYTAIKIVEFLPYFQPSINFNKLGDITPSNLNKLKDEIKKHIVDLETAITESVNFIDSGVPGQNNLPYLPEGCVWFRDPIIKNVIALPISDLYGKFNQMVEALKKEFEKVLIAGADEALIEIIKKFKEETDKQLGILAGAGSAFKPKQVANIEILKNVNAKVDEVYEVLGYYRFDDGANHKRKISNKDDGSGIQLTNGLWANIVHNGELHVDWFGTIGDGRNEQHIFSKITDYVQKGTFTELKIVFPYAKNFEFGDQYESSSHSATTRYYETIHGFAISRKNLTLEFDLNFCNFKRKPNLYYGAFHPETGEVYNHSGEAFWNNAYGIFVPNLINIGEIQGFKVTNGYIDGNNLNDTIGGRFGDTGYQLQSTGIRCTGAQLYIEVNNIHVKNVHLDGFSLSGTTKNGDYKYTRLTNFTVERAGRMGVTIAGGRNILLENGVITYAGSDSLPVSSMPKSGCDIENESGSKLENVQVINCHFEECGATCFVMSVGDSSGIYLKNSRFINRTNQAVWLVANNSVIENCVICGRCASIGNKNYQLPIYNSIITDWAKQYSILTDESLSEFHVKDKPLMERYVDLIKCTIRIRNPERQYIFYNDVITYDCIYDVININTSSMFNNFKYMLGNTVFKNNKNDYYRNSNYISAGKSFLNHFGGKKLFLDSTNENVHNPSFRRIDSYGDGNPQLSNQREGVKGDIRLKASFNKADRIFAYWCTKSGNNNGAENQKATISTTEGSDIVKLYPIEGSDVFGINGYCFILNVPSDSSLNEVLIYKKEIVGREYVECLLSKKASKTADKVPCEFPLAEWTELKVASDNPVSTVNTLYYGEKMKEEGVYNDFMAYMDEKTAYDKEQKNIEEQKQLAYIQAIKENHDLGYEEFLSMQPMTLNLIASEEPQPSEALKKFMEKYL